MGKALGIGTIMLAVALAGAPALRADVIPPKADPCLHEQAGTDCQVEYISVPGRCRWISARERSDMEIVGPLRCVGEHDKPTCIACVSAIYEGDDAALGQRAMTLARAGKFDDAERVVQYLSHKRDGCVRHAVLWQAVGDVEEAAGRTAVHAFRMAIQCQPFMHLPYRDLAAAWVSRARPSPDALLGNGVLLEYSRLLANLNISADGWQAHFDMIEKDPRLEKLRKHQSYRFVRERFEWGRREAAKESRPTAFYCKTEAKTWGVLDAQRYRNDCIVPKDVALCPSPYLKVRTSMIPSSLPTCPTKRGDPVCSESSEGLRCSFDGM